MDLADNYSTNAFKFKEVSLAYTLSPPVVMPVTKEE
jgi:hypothetical protein